MTTTDIFLRIEGRAGRATLTRPQALNALSYDMCQALDAALRNWATDPAVDLVMIDAEGERAFCAGGDIAELYAEGRRGNPAYGQAFWRDEYRMNARIGAYPKPVITFIQGFCMGGGVGVACHASHRIVGETAQIALPECAIGLVPDVGGSALLARAPGYLGRYLGMTGARMGPGDAIHAGFADAFVPICEWQNLQAQICKSGDLSQLPAIPPPSATLPALQADIDHFFRASTLSELRATLAATPSHFAQDTLKALDRGSPLAIATTLTMQQTLGPAPDLLTALELEYRVTHRAQTSTDFLEGIRAMVIDKDRNPKWRHLGTTSEVAALLEPLGSETLDFKE